jgi:hypothetical protein
MALVITDVSEELVASVFRVDIISELRTTLAVTRNYWVSARHNIATNTRKN